MAIHALNKLEKISIGIYELKESEFLNSSNLKAVTELTLSGSKVKSIDLKYLSQYKNLKRLRLAEYTKNIDAVGEITDLEHLSLNSIKKTPIGFVNNLKKLKELEITLGGRDNIQEIEENEIESLTIDWVRGFNDISNISKFKRLKTLSIEKTIQLAKIHFDKELKHLKTLWIIDCKSLKSLTGLERLESLEHLRVSKTLVDINEILDQKLPTSLGIFAFYTWKTKIDEAIRLTLDKKGYKEWSR
jgi:Leucine-rich repeat (LRR) protein